MVALLIGDQQRTRRKVDQFGGVTFFFFWRTTENSKKSRPIDLFCFRGQQKTRRRADQLKNLGTPQECNYAPLRTAF